MPSRFRPNYQIAIISGCGLAGILLALLLGEAKGGECSEEEKHKEYADEFRKLLGFFHRYFILSAILLSLVVLCTGALYSAVNSLSFVRLHLHEKNARNTRYWPVKTPFFA